MKILEFKNTVAKIKNLTKWVDFKWKKKESVNLKIDQ